MKTKSLILVVASLFVISWGVSSSYRVSAQAPGGKLAEVLSPCSGEKLNPPSSISLGSSAFRNFIAVMSKTRGDRQNEFSGLTKEEKADLIRVKLAVELAKRSDLTENQRGFIVDAILRVSTDLYNNENLESRKVAQKETEAFIERGSAIFTSNELFEIFSTLNNDYSSEVNTIKRFEEVLSLPMRQRKETVGKMTASEKKDFWKNQLIYHLATSMFSKAQRSFIANLFPLMTIEAFDFPAEPGLEKNEQTRRMESYVNQAYDQYSKNEVIAVFIGYGLHKVVPENDASIGTDPVNSLIRRCDCNYVCGWSTCCTETSCAISKDGCGVFGGSECNNYCLNC